MLYVILWLLCGMGAAALYQRKGRSWLAAFVVGLLLGPIGVILAALAGPNWAEVQRCPSCRELNPRHKQRCKACGAALP